MGETPSRKAARTSTSRILQATPNKESTPASPALPSPSPSRRRPRPSTTPTTPPRSSFQRGDVDEQAEIFARRLQQAVDLLLKRLTSYLSQLPAVVVSPNDDHDDRTLLQEDEQSTPNQKTNTGGGMTLPLTAVAWLSSQLHPPPLVSMDGAVPPTVWSSRSVQQRLRQVEPLLSRITYFRTVDAVWPPPLPEEQPGRRRGLSFRAVSQVPTTPTRPPPMNEVNVSVWSDVASVLTMEDGGGGGLMGPTTPTTNNPVTSRQAFWDFMQSLQDHPHINIGGLFPNCKVLVLETKAGIAPSLENLHALHNRLELFQWKHHGGHNGETTTTTANQVGVSWKETFKSLGNNESKSKPFSKLTHLEWNGMLRHNVGDDNNYDDDLSRLLPQFPNLQKLNLSHNNGWTAPQGLLDGLQHAVLLESLNLCHNQISALPINTHLYLGGQLKRLDLSHNQLTSVQGMDRLYALEDLNLSHNQLPEVSTVAPLMCRLPQLRSLDLQGNPLEIVDPLYPKQLWAWCLEARQDAMTLQDLPTLNGRSITVPQWNSLVQEMMAPVVLPFGSTTMTTNEESSSSAILTTEMMPPRDGTQHQGRRRKRPASRRAVIQRTTDNHPNKATTVARRSRYCSSSARSHEITQVVVSFAIEDVLTKLDTIPAVNRDTNNVPHVDEKMGIQESPALDKSVPKLSTSESMESLDSVWDVNHQLLPLEPVDDDEFDKMRPQGGEDSTEDMTISTTTKEEFYGLVLQKVNEATATMSTEGSTSKTVIKSNQTLDMAISGTNKPIVPCVFNVMSADWDDLVTRVANGLIPDGKPRMPLPELAATIDTQNDTPFSEDAADLLPDEPVLLVDAQDGGGGSIYSSSNGLRSALPEQIYSDDCSVLSSLGTNRDDFPVRTNKFQLAEENATYDGPEAWTNRNVLENLKDYFQLYVFPSSIKSLAEVQDDDGGGIDDWQQVASKYPRIQLYPDDRRGMHLPSPSNVLAPTTQGSSSHEIDDWTLLKRESFVSVWEEDVVPCGKSSLRRLAPNRRIRLGFHGDQLYIGGVPDPYAECRKVHLCLSSAAFYIIVKSDDVAKKVEEKGLLKKFPNAIPDDATFEDAPWPHAVARHTYQDLQALIIGFEFQRLTLQFVNPLSRKADPFVYILLTSNKKQTVKLLQQLQKLAKDATPEAIDLNSDADTTRVAIENDSQDVMDAIQVAVSPAVIDVILHYQIVQQRWKHGEGRGMVRRVCVVTDTKLFLMNEDYAADSHKPLDPPTTGAGVKKKKRNGMDLAKVSYRLVDEAALQQVIEVQAAGADPKAITIMIKPQGRLARTHRWRLVCRDNVGAERLVEDVRKAMAMLE